MVTSRFPQIRARHEQANRTALRRVLGDQVDDVLARLDAGSSTLLSERWDAALAAVIFNRNRATAADVGGRVAAMLRGPFDPDILDELLETNADIAAEQINTSTRDRIAGLDREAVVAQLDILQDSRLVQVATTMVAFAASAGANDAARAGGVRLKRWRTTSSDPRSEHAAMNGATAPIDGRFSNGMRWPGDASGASGASDVANCQCVLEFVRRS
jgi:hypothetical protein